VVVLVVFFFSLYHVKNIHFTMWSSWCSISLNTWKRYLLKLYYITVIVTIIALTFTAYA